MSSEQAFNNWVVIRDPGCTPDLKGPFRPVQVAPFLREVFECRPYSFVEVITVTNGGIVSVQDGPECLEMTDGRSAPIARKHRARLSASLLDGLGQTKSADCGQCNEQSGNGLSPISLKKTYIKPLRTIVEIDARYADQIRDLLNAVPSTNLIEKLIEYNKDWRTRAGSAGEVNEAIAALRELAIQRDASAAATDYLLEICDGSNWPEEAQTGLGYRLYTEITERLHEIALSLQSNLSRAKATEGKAGMAVGTPHVRLTTAGTGLRVGEASADLPATSEFMGVTAGETALNSPAVAETDANAPDDARLVSGATLNPQNFPPESGER